MRIPKYRGYNYSIEWLTTGVFIGILLIIFGYIIPVSASPYSPEAIYEYGDYHEPGSGLDPFDLNDWKEAIPEIVVGIIMFSTLFLIPRLISIIYNKIAEYNLQKKEKIKEKNKPAIQKIWQKVNEEMWEKGYPTRPWSETEKNVKKYEQAVQQWIDTREKRLKEELQKANIKI